MRLQHDAAIARKAAAQQRIEDLGAQIAQMELAKSQAIDSARQRVLSEQYSLNTNQLNFERVEKLLKPGYVSQRDFELAKLAIDSSEANLQSAKAILERTEREMDASISSIKGSRSSAQSDLASADRDITLKLGKQDYTFKGMDYLLKFAQPNFYFHVTTAYNILRHNGVELIKKDYVGKF
jgi:multidrug resistance efflux pump